MLTGMDADKLYQTEPVVLMEEDIITGILWEGDLELHSNEVVMKDTAFGKPIGHGDGAAVKAIAQILIACGLDRREGLRIRRVECAFVGPAFAGDKLQTEFTITSKTDDTVEICFRTDKEGGSSVADGIVEFTAKPPTEPKSMMLPEPSPFPAPYPFVGGEEGVTAGKTVTAADVDLFYQTIYGRGELTRKRETVPELLTAMITIGLMNRLGFLDGSLKAVAESNWTFGQWVREGDTLTAQYVVSDVRTTKKGSKILTFSLATVNQNQQVVAEGSWKTVMR